MFWTRPCVQSTCIIHLLGRGFRSGQRLASISCLFEASLALHPLAFKCESCVAENSASVLIASQVINPPRCAPIGVPTSCFLPCSLICRLFSAAGQGLADPMCFHSLPASVRDGCSCWYKSGRESQTLFCT